LYLALTSFYFTTVQQRPLSAHFTFFPQAGNNAPLRGHKAELFEGGIRNNALIYSKSTRFVPTAMRGASYDGGLVHVTDWHAAFANISGSTLKGFELDGNEKVFAAVIANGTSPRTEFLVNIYDGDTMGPSGAAYVDWPYKLYLNVSNATWTPIPTGNDDDEVEVEMQYTFGVDEATGGQGWVGGTDDFEYVPSIGSELNMAHPVDRAIAKAWGHASANSANSADSADSELVDDEAAAPTISALFNLDTDPTEHHNLIAQSAMSATVAAITAKINAMRAKAMPPCSNGGTKAGAGQGCAYADPAAVAAAEKVGAWLPWY
jgi:hypothetical protein